ncbi:immunity repressor [Gordonia phage Hibiscus]
MTTAYESGLIPEFDKADRLKKAISVSGVSMAAMADYLDIKRETLSRYVNGKAEAPVAYVRLIALRTGVPFEWIETGNTPAGPNGPDGGDGECARRDSNPKPSVREVLSASVSRASSQVIPLPGRTKQPDPKPAVAEPAAA